MRWSSSTTRICGALSSSDSMASPVSIGSASVAGGSCCSCRQELLHRPALFLADHAEKKPPHNRVVARARGCQGCRDPLGLQLVETARQVRAFCRNPQQPLAAVVHACLL